MSGRIIERCFIDTKTGNGQLYIDLFPEFKRMLMSTSGAIATRLLRARDNADRFLLEMEFESQVSKDSFIAHPDLKHWAQLFWPNVDNEVIIYYDEVG